jgi:hypothetical protein
LRARLAVADRGEQMYGKAERPTRLSSHRIVAPADQCGEGGAERPCGDTKIVNTLGVTTQSFVHEGEDGPRPGPQQAAFHSKGMQARATPCIPITPAFYFPGSFGFA